MWQLAGLVRNLDEAFINMDEPRIERSIVRHAFWLVVGFSFLIFFAQTRSFKLLIDGLTYTAIAKNILTTGDWKTPHYFTAAYQDFYEHPPLAMWMQALVFKFFGFSEPMARALSSGAAVLSVAAVFAFTRRVFSLPAATWAAVVLFTSSRYIKWGTNFYFDAILGFFILGGICSWILAIQELDRLSSKNLLLSFMGGVSFAAAFLTKGVVSFSGLAIAAFSLFLFFSGKNLIKFFLLFVGFALPFLFWFQWGDGLHYLQSYFALSVAGRVQTHQFFTGPWVNLKSTWLPWWPVMVLACFHLFYRLIRRGFASEEKISLLMILLAASFPIAFSLGSTYYEHYLVPFYPFAAIVVGVELSRFGFFSRVTEDGLKIGYGILLIGSLFVATIAPSFHVVKDLEAMQWVAEIGRLPAEDRAQVKKIAFTDKATNVWYGIANIRGKTDFETEASFDLSREAMDGTILFTTREETPRPSWKPISCIYVEGYRAYASETLHLCRNI